MTMSAPSLAKTTACERPWPRAPPVITAVLPSSRPIASSYLDLHALDQGCRAKATAAAHRHQAQFAIQVFQFVQERRRQASPCGAEWMTERYRAAAGIHALEVGA